MTFQMQSHSDLHMPLAQRTNNSYPFIISSGILNNPISCHIDPIPADYDLTRAGQEGFIGAYSPELRRKRIEKFLEKRNKRVWTKKVNYTLLVFLPSSLEKKNV